MDETGLFFRTTTDKTLFHKAERCSGGKKAKVRMTVMLCANMVGEKEKPLVIWKYKNPRCFNNINVKDLPVEYYANKNAWMTSGVFEERLKTFDRKIGFKKCKVLLFIDNATSHCHLTFNNIKLQFFPANRTSQLQPMDQGIIQVMKLKILQVTTTEHGGCYAEGQIRLRITIIERC